MVVSRAACLQAQMVFGLSTLGICARRLAPFAVLLSAALLFVAGLVRVTRLEPVALRAIPQAPASGRLAVVVLRAASGDGGADAAEPAAVAGARVRVFHALSDERYTLVAESRTDAQGRLQQRGLPMGHGWLLVDSPGLERWSQVVVVEAGAPAPVEVTLQAAQPLQVEVREAPERPLQGATVIARGSSGLPFGAVTGADGRVAFEQVPAGPLQVEVFARGYEPVRRESVQRQLQVELRPLGGIEARVLAPDGDAASQAEVLLVGSSLWPARRLQTDERGLARMTNLPAGVYDLRARSGSLVSAIVSGVRLERGQRRKLDLRLLPGREVQVLVRAARSEPPQPIAGARVVLAEHGLSAFPLQAISDAAGKVRLGTIPDGPAYLSVRAAD